MPLGLTRFLIYLTTTVAALGLGVFIGLIAGHSYLTPERADQKVAEKVPDHTPDQVPPGQLRLNKSGQLQLDEDAKKGVMGENTVVGPTQMDSSGAPGPGTPVQNTHVQNFPTIAVDAENAVYATTRNKDLGPKVAVMLQGINNTTLPLLARLDKDGNYRLECVLPSVGADQ